MSRLEDIENMLVERIEELNDILSYKDNTPDEEDALLYERDDLELELENIRRYQE